MNFDGSVPASGVVVQSINMSPLLAQQLIDALQQNRQGYAAKAMPPEIETSEASPSKPSSSQPYSCSWP